MTEAQLRQCVVDVMSNWLGYSEANGKHKQIIDIYNAHKPLARGYAVKYTDEWCATTVSAAFIKTGLTDIAPTECSCNKMIDLYKARGRWKEADDYVPRPGDILMYDWQDTGVGDDTGLADHVGIVAAVAGRNITVIEGNKNEAVAKRQMVVNGKFIRGYCLPNYASKATSVSTTPTVQNTTVDKIDAAKSFNKAYARSYTVTASCLNMRRGASTDKGIVAALGNGTIVTCYGYYTVTGSTIWLYVKTSDGSVGYCSKKYLK